MPAVSSSGRPAFLRPLDVVLLAILTVGGVLTTWRIFHAPAGGRAMVWVDGRRTAWYPLEGALTRDTIAGELGPVVVEHGGGSIRIVEAPCPGKLCIRQGHAHRVGEKLVCVPSRVVVSIEGDADPAEAVDADN